MSMIVIGVEMPINCVECHEKGIRNLLDCELIFGGCANCGRHPKCSLKSIDGLIENIDKKANSGQWSDATTYGMYKAIAIIKEYCGMEGEA